MEGKFRKAGRRNLVGKSQSNSLSDIIFMILFFFMTATTLKDQDLKVMVSKPSATELEKLEDKNLVVTINIGKPVRQYQAFFGSEPRVQINDSFVEINDIPSLMINHRENMKESDQAKMIVSLKGDKQCPMGIITDVKQALRKAAALKINYSANQI